jgi:predicted transposase YbfD/YdcC
MHTQSSGKQGSRLSAIPELLKLLDLHGCIVTIDAMGTQTAIAQEIVASGNVHTLIGNQRDPHADIQ